MMSSKVQKVVDKYVPLIAAKLEVSPDEVVILRSNKGNEYSPFDEMYPSGVNYYTSLFYKVLIKQSHREDFVVSWWQMGQLPGCCAIAIMHGAKVAYPFKQKGLGTLLQAFRIDLARAIGYSMVIATDTTNNLVQAKIFKNNNWSEVTRIKNLRTNNTVQVWVKNIREE